MVLYTTLPVERRYYSFYLRLMSWMRVRMGEPRATLFGRVLVPSHQVGPPFWRYDWNQNNWQFSSYHLSAANIPHYLDKLEQVKPTELRGYSSSLVQLARRILADGRVGRIRPRAVHTTAETLLTTWKEELEAAFLCPVFDMYGSSEMSHFVTTCESGRYHVHPEFGTIEILVDGRPARPGEEGEIVCTSFVNTVQPLVRYRIGDRAVQGEGPCPCGRAFPVLECILGRMDDYIITPDGRQVGRLDPVFKGSGGIRECQIVQDRRDRLTLKLVRANGFGEDDAKKVVNELRKRTGDLMEIRVQYVKGIPKEANGKFRSVVREFEAGADSEEPL
jgi:phenylacetate-CoA ligase